VRFGYLKGSQIIANSVIKDYLKNEVVLESVGLFNGGIFFLSQQLLNYVFINCLSNIHKPTFALFQLYMSQFRPA
jgi:hypothetical protein